MIAIYQLLPRIFGNSKTTNRIWGTIDENGCGKFNDINDNAIKSIKELGATHIWLTGIIQHATSTDYSEYKIPSDNPLIVKGRAGSPYAIKNYFDVDPDLAENVNNRFSEFRNLIERIHNHNLKVIIDFVPNHVARNYVYNSNFKNTNHNTKYDIGINENTTVTFDVNNNFYYIENKQFQIPEEVLSLHNIKSLIEADNIEKYIEYPAKATGNDCFTEKPSYTDWYETVKLNYGIDYRNNQKHFSFSDDSFIPHTWKCMLEILKFWANQGVDGFRCDMAEMVPIEFWHWAIPKIKESFKDIFFIAEIYKPHLYAEYINLGGFDYLYDKVGLYDAIRDIITNKASVNKITESWQKLSDVCLNNNINCNDKMLRFMENHDEQRIASNHFADDAKKGIPGFAVSALMHKGPAMLYFGQELGISSDEPSGYSNQDGRTTIFDYWSEDKIVRWNNNGKFNIENLTDEEIKLRKEYNKILNFAKENIFSKGDFYDLMWLNNHLYEKHCFAFVRGIKNKEMTIVVVNFSNEDVHTFINIEQHVIDYFNMSDKSNCQKLDLLIKNYNWNYIKI